MFCHFMFIIFIGIKIEKKHNEVWLKSKLGQKQSVFIDYPDKQDNVHKIHKIPGQTSTKVSVVDNV